MNMLGTRTPIQQGGWQIVGMLITVGTALICGVVVGVLCKIFNRFTVEDQFND